MIIGRHAIADLAGCPPELLVDEDWLNRTFSEALSRVGATVVALSSYKFPGEGGVTGLFLLSESHASYQTYPEYTYIAIDIFTCGGCDPDRALDFVSRQLKASFSESMSLRRQIPSPPATWVSANSGTVCYL